MMVRIQTLGFHMMLSCRKLPTFQKNLLLYFQVKMSEKGKIGEGCSCCQAQQYMLQSLMKRLFTVHSNSESHITHATMDVLIVFVEMIQNYSYYNSD
jgi:hypothetical protein